MHHVSSLVADDPYNAFISSPERDQRPARGVHVACVTIRVVERDIKASLLETARPINEIVSAIIKTRAGTFNRADRSPNEDMSLEGATDSRLIIV